MGLKGRTTVALPPTPLVDLVLGAELIIVAGPIRLLSTLPEPQKSPPVGWHTGMPAPPGWSPAEPVRLVEVAVDRVVMGAWPSAEPPTVLVRSTMTTRSSHGGHLMFLRALPGQKQYAELSYTSTPARTPRRTWSPSRIGAGRTVRGHWAFGHAVTSGGACAGSGDARTPNVAAGQTHADGSAGVLHRAGLPDPRAAP